MKHDQKIKFKGEGHHVPEGEAGDVFYVVQVVTGSKRALFKLIGEFNENLKDIIIWD